jgi:hypothetical protein
MRDNSRSLNESFYSLLSPAGKPTARPFDFVVDQAAGKTDCRTESGIAADGAENRATARPDAAAILRDRMCGTDDRTQQPDARH